MTRKNASLFQQVMGDEFRKLDLRCSAFTACRASMSWRAGCRPRRRRLGLPDCWR